jgi:hypothetical protein
VRITSSHFWKSPNWPTFLDIAAKYFVQFGMYFVI